MKLSFFFKSLKNRPFLKLCNASLLYFLTLLNSSAQIYNFERYSLPEGLSQSQVFDITQDSLGRIWLATERGGVTILSGDFPQYIGRSEGLPGTATLSLFHDKNARMWIGTNKGVRYYNGKNLTIPKNGELLDSMFVWNITQRTDGIIVMATNKGVYGYNDSLGCFNLIPELENKQISKIAARSNNLLYITVFNQPLLIFDGHELEEVELPLTDGSNIELVFFDSQDRIWIGTTRGLITREDYYYKTITTKEGLSDDHIISLAEDRFGNIWAGTDEGGVSIISNDRILNIDSDQGIGYNRIYSIYRDNYFNMWVGTDGAGAYVFKGFRFTKMQLPEFSETTSILALHVTKDNRICIGSNGNGLLVVKNKSRKHYSKKDGLTNSVIRTVTSNKKGTLLLGSDRGVDFIQKGKVDIALRETINIKEPVSCSYTTTNDNFIVGTFGHGLYRIENKSVSKLNTKNGLAGNHVYDIIENKKGDLFIATDQGLSIISNHKIKNYSEANGLISNLITSLVIDKNDRLWIISENGITRFDTDSLYHLPIDKISDANIVYSVTNDLFGNLVLGTERGIDILSLDTASSPISKKSYRRHDGFFGIECNLNAVASNSSGELLFGTKQGATKYNPLTDSIQNPLAKAYIRDIELFYSKVKWDKYTDSISNWSLLPLGLELPYSENNLTFYFGANDYQTPQKLKLQFYLQGFDPNWMPPTKQRFVNYTNLPPGTYTMKVRSWYSAQNVSNYVACFSFVILKPYYARNWFVISMIVLIISLTVLIWKLRVKSIRTNERRLESLIKERVADLRKQKEELELANIKISQGARMKEQFLANTSHEIRTPLNVVTGYTNLLLNTRVDNQQQKYLRYIKDSSDNLKVIINDILDFSKIEADKLEFENVPFDFVKTIRTTGNHMEIEAAKHGLSLELSFNNISHNVIIGDPVRLNQILSNLVRNSIKFTPSGTITIDITDQSSNEETIELKINIMDTGIGILPEKLETIFDSFSQASNETTRKFGGTGLGLTIVKRLVEKQKGTIKVTSEIDKGSCFSIIIPYPKSDANPLEENKLDYTINPHSLSKDIKILLVDDNEINLALAENTLTSFSSQFKIETAMNGMQAVDAASRVLYDIIIMDIQMPEMDGYTATKVIRNRLSAPLCNVPILGMTAHAMSDEREKCLQHGMNEYITKPFAPRHLFELVLNLTNANATKLGDYIDINEQQMPSFAALDPQQLWKNSTGKIDRFIRYLSMYANAIPTQIKELETGIKSGKIDEIRILSHTLKTSFRYLGMKKAQTSALEIEKAALENEVVDYKELLKEINICWNNASPEITTYLKKNTKQKKS